MQKSAQITETHQSASMKKKGMNVVSIMLITAMFILVLVQLTTKVSSHILSHLSPILGGLLPDEFNLLFRIFFATNMMNIRTSWKNLRVFIVGGTVPQG
jgi:hypothetical protein